MVLSLENLWKCLGLSLLLISLVGCCSCPADLSGELNATRAELVRTNQTLTETLTYYTILVKRIESVSVENTELKERNENLSKSVSFYRSLCNTNVTSTGKYSFSCSDVMPGDNYLTAYKCYWETRTHYGFGKYYTPAICQIPEYSLPDVCACFWSIPELSGT